MSALDGKALLDHGEAIARRYASRIGADVAEELRGEAVLRALRSPAPDGRMEPWLERIYKNLLIDHWRRPQPITVDIAEMDASGSASTPEDAALQAERRRLVRASLRCLPRETRRVLLSRYYGELDESTTASRLGIAGTTVRTRVHRALARLRTRLAALRSFLMPSFGRWAGQLLAVGAAPILVATLMATPSPEPRPPVAVTSLARASVTSRAAMPPQAQPLPTPAAPRLRVRAQKKPSGSPVVLAVEQATPSATEILWPDRMDIFADPQEPPPPSLIEVPTTFAPLIVSMVEDGL
jgi:RNA polymerase sigma-70 factor (ECF subfamily)